MTTNEAFNELLNSMEGQVLWQQAGFERDKLFYYRFRLKNNLPISEKKKVEFLEKSGFTQIAEPKWTFKQPTKP
jgi:hypothetical protein